MPIDRVNRRAPEARLPYSFGVYGVALHSAIPLALAPLQGRCATEISLETASQAFFAEAIADLTLRGSDDSWYQYAQRSDGAWYARWEGVGEFLVCADGTRIFCRQQSRARSESFHVYLLGQALSFALVQRGLEPLHATAVGVDGSAVAFLGASGLGKSTLAAAFAQAGYGIITDDVLVVRRGASGPLASVGPPRIKLFPDIGQRLLPAAAAGVPMNPDTSKLVLPLAANLTCTEALPLRVIYSLAPQSAAASREVRAEPLSAKDAFLELIKHTFNARIVGAARLRRQFEETGRLSAELPVKRLVYARDLDTTAQIVAWIAEDVANTARTDEIPDPDNL